VLGRVGGEEFLAAFADVRPGEAALIAERLREAVARAPVEIGPGLTVPVTVSGGLVSLGAGDEGLSIEDALSRADAALYRAKQGGRDRIVLAE
jgi:diguanylate cyclase (GGDEF)-like protein